MLKRTPGEWESVFLSDNVTLAIRSKDEGAAIAVVFDRPENEARGNAALMVASPKLLEALDKLLSVTVDAMLSEGYELTQEQEDARQLALEAIELAVIEK